jgi:hypothetical protein
VEVEAEVEAIGKTEVVVVVADEAAEEDAAGAEGGDEAVKLVTVTLAMSSHDRYMRTHDITSDDEIRI